MNEVWKGGNVRTSTGGGFKVNLLKRNLERYKDDKDLILFFTDRQALVAIKTTLNITENLRMIKKFRGAFENNFDGSELTLCQIDKE